MSIVDQLLSHPGLYLGSDLFVETGNRGAARIEVQPLPGGAGVSLGYEVLNPGSPDRILGHREETFLARSHDGGVIMVIAHTHAESVAILRETEPGCFELGPEGSPFPMKVIISVPEPGRLRHSWWYGRPGEEAIERDVAELTLVA